MNLIHSICISVNNRCLMEYQLYARHHVCQELVLVAADLPKDYFERCSYFPTPAKAKLSDFCARKLRLVYSDRIGTLLRPTQKLFTQFTVLGKLLLPLPEYLLFKLFLQGHFGFCVVGTDCFYVVGIQYFHLGFSLRSG